MPPLQSAGRPANSDSSLVRSVDLTNRFAETQVDLAYVDQAVDARASALALKSYVDSQDGKYATIASVNSADGNYVAKSLLDAASGVPTLDSTGLTKPAQIPTVRPDRTAQWYGITRWWLSGVAQTSSNTDTSVRICEITYADPGFPYIPMFFGDFHVKSEEFTAFGHIIAKMANGNYISYGSSTALLEWHSVPVVPFAYSGDTTGNTRAYTGSGVITVYGFRNSGNGAISISSSNGFGALVLMPAL